MKDIKRRTQLERVITFVTFLCGFSLLISTLGVLKIKAQSSEDWSEPANLSHSGSANTPVLVVDSNGRYHALWIDEFAGYMYVSGDGLEWSQPVPVDFPFGGAVPELVADKKGFIHAFWMNSGNELFYSSARGVDFGSPSAWTPPVQLAESALDISTSLDQNGNIHLAYIRAEDSTEFPAGIYYRWLATGDTSWIWSLPTNLYSSPYFRSLEPTDSSVDITTSTISGEVYVYTVWDNRPRGKVYLAISPDGGQTWGSAEEIDRPDNGSGSNSSANIRVGANENDVLLVWQRRNSAGSCTQYYQVSKDHGVTWSQPGEVMDGPGSCEQDDQLLDDSNGTTYLWTAIQSQINLIAWNWQQWSEPQVQNDLSGFPDPETLKSVTYDCRMPVLVDTNRLAVVGCDTNGGGDIWFTSRNLDATTDWYSKQSAWKDAEKLVSSAFKINSPVLIAAPDNTLHVLWSQNDRGGSENGQAAIYYASWNGDDWTESTSVVSSPNDSLTEPSAAIDASGRLLAVWSTSKEGKIYFSWANSANAQNYAEWSEPVSLVNSVSFASSPKILVSKSGIIYVVYAIPVNEGRGIYLTRSEDEGETWSLPVQIFDGVAANWQMVDNPQLVEGPDGVLHAIWSQRSIQDYDNLMGLYYSRSDDGGNTWSNSQAVTDESVMWSQIASSVQGSLFRIWQEGDQLQPVIKYQFSRNSGLNWSTEESLGSFGEKSLMAKLIMPPSGNLHMLQLVQDSSGDFILRDWVWENEHWSVNEYFDLTEISLEEAYSMESTSSLDGNLAMIFSAKAATQPGDPAQYDLFYTNRALGLPPSEPVQSIATPISSPLLAPTESSVSSVGNLPEIQPTPTPDLSALISTGSPTSSSSSFMGLGRGVLISGLIIGAVVIFGVWKKRRN